MNRRVVKGLQYARGGIVACGLTGMLIACSNSPTGPTDADVLPDVSEFVTGAAMANLDDNGHFVLPPGEGGQWVPILTSAEVLDLACIFVRTVARDGILPGGSGALRELIEAGHGGPIEWDEVGVSERDRVFFADTPFEPPDETLPAPIRNFWGPQYLVRLWGNHLQVATVSVAATATGFEVVDCELMQAPDEGGNEFFSVGVPAGASNRLPVDPEVAVQFAAELTGALIAEVPTLLAPGNRVAPMGARWRLVLDRRVLLRRFSDGLTIRRDTIYVAQSLTAAEDVSEVGDALRLMVPATSQPAGEYALIREEDTVSEVWIPRDEELPVEFKEVEAVPNS